MKEWVLGQLQQLRSGFDVVMEKSTDEVLHRAKGTFDSQLESWDTFEARHRAKVAQNLGRLRTRFSFGFAHVMKQLNAQTKGRLRRSSSEGERHE